MIMYKVQKMNEETINIITNFIKIKDELKIVNAEFARITAEQYRIDKIYKKAKEDVKQVLF